MLNLRWLSPAGRRHQQHACAMRMMRPVSVPLPERWYCLYRLFQEKSTQQSRSILTGCRCFHGTPTRPMMMVAVSGAGQRRRKREPAGILHLDRTRGNVKNVKNDDDEHLHHKTHQKKMTSLEFRVQSAHLLSRIHAALVPLRPINPDMIVSRGRNELHDNEQQDKDRHEAQEDEDEDVKEDKNTSVGEYLWIDLGPRHGQYTIQADETMQIVMLLSHISGQRVYRYHNSNHNDNSNNNNRNNNSSSSSKSDPTQGETLPVADPVADPDPNRWMCTDDGHVLEGLLVRDLIRQIQGVPNL